MIGGLRHRVTIERKARVSDGDGGAAESWSAVETVWAKVEPLSGFMQMQAEQAQFRRTHKVTLRAGADVTQNDRLDFEGRKLAIKGLKDIEERGRWTVIDCEEGAPT